MIYYKVKCNYTFAEGIDEREQKRIWEDISIDICIGETRYKMFVYDHDETSFDAVLMFSVKENALSSVKESLLNEIGLKHEKKMNVSFSDDPEEITVEDAVELTHKGLMGGYSRSYGRGSRRHAADICKASYASHSELEYDELILPHTDFSYEEALSEAQKLLADDTMLEEIERIYSPLNKRAFCGSPVHYKINAASRETAVKLVKLLTKALFTNKRVLSARMTVVNDPDCGSYDELFEELCDNSYASVIAIECDDDNIDEDGFARDSERKCELIYNSVKEYASQSVFILIDLGSKVCKQSVGRLVSKEGISFIEIFEGKGDAESGKKYLASLLKENEVPYAEEDFVLPQQAEYSVHEIVKVYKDIKKNSIKNSIYRAYKDVETIKVEAPKSLSNGYDKLQSMVGLTEIKSIIDQIISAQKMNKARRDMGLDTVCSSKHMIFTGNPGSAKTTVARLLASILYDEHVLDKNKFIECGRQDLVGRFVGWTAKQVEAQFQKARGGILFIDEAYSLVEREGLYGDEAINTIVQMMENYRNDVIVIFAGYPDKMERFLEKNEGLRSRIAFHVDFPDYNAEELCDILKLMSKEKGYVLDEEAEKKCRLIFDCACKNAEFGNGRFVRNVLEQAIIKQSSRIVSEHQNETFDKQIISTLSASDFDINAAKTYKPKPTRTAIGF